MDGLTVGRMVHFVDADGVHLAAIVTHVVERVVAHKVMLGVHHPTKGYITIPWGVPYDERPLPELGTWHWIERA